MHTFFTILFLIGSSVGGYFSYIQFEEIKKLNWHIHSIENENTNLKNKVSDLESQNGELKNKLYSTQRSRDKAKKQARQNREKAESVRGELEITQLSHEYSETKMQLEIDDWIEFTREALKLSTYERSNKASEWFNKAYRKTDDNHLKIKYYTKSILLDPDESYSYNNRGVAYERLGKRDEAISDYKMAIQLDRYNEIAKRNLRLIE
jgi:tetratricopeptide (TPR) repeat protein